MRHPHRKCCPVSPGRSPGSSPTCTFCPRSQVAVSSAGEGVGVGLRADSSETKGEASFVTWDVNRGN